MALDLNAIKAAAAKMQEQAKAQTEAQAKTQTKAQTKAQTKTQTKAQTNTDTPKTKGGAKYVIPAEFKTAIENYLKGREDMKEKLTQKGKSLEGCCDYIFDVMRKRAEKARNGATSVGMYAAPDEIFGLAVHYYDETEKALKEELKAK